MATVPDWVGNLRANPAAAAWIRRSRIHVVAEELTGAGRDRAHQEALKVWPRVRRYELKSGRAVPYFRLVPEAHPDPP